MAPHPRRPAMPLGPVLPQTDRMNRPRAPSAGQPSHCRRLRRQCGHLRPDPPPAPLLASAAAAEEAEIVYREVAASELQPALLAQIDRSERRTAHYVMETRKYLAGTLKRVEKGEEIPDLTDAHREFHAERLRGCVASGGTVLGAFTGSGSLLGLCGLDGTWLGREGDTLDMCPPLRPLLLPAPDPATFPNRESGAGRRYYLFTDQTRRDAGVGGVLFTKIMDVARQKCAPPQTPSTGSDCSELRAGVPRCGSCGCRGAAKMYISATNTAHTVDFYMRAPLAPRRPLASLTRHGLACCARRAWCGVGGGDFRGGGRGVGDG